MLFGVSERTLAGAACLPRSAIVDVNDFFLLCCWPIDRNVTNFTDHTVSQNPCAFIDTDLYRPSLLVGWARLPCTVIIYGTATSPTKKVTGYFRGGLQRCRGKGE